MTLEEKKARLVELKAKLAQMKQSASIDAERGGLKAAAERLMVDDPIAAFGLLGDSRTLDIKEQQAAKDARYDPDSVRFKLASRSNAISGQLSGMAANNPAYKPLLDEQNRIKLELAKDNPSIQAVYAGETPAEIIDPGTGTATYATIQADIKGATKETYEAVASKVATDKGVAKLSADQEKRIDDLLAQKRKELFPAAKKTDSEIISKIKDDMTAEEFKGYSVPSALYNAGVSNMKLGTYGTAIQNFIKAANPGESVMDGDVNMANKGQVDNKLLTILKRIGYDATNDNVQVIAYNLGLTAQEALKKKLIALDTYNLTPQQKALFVKRYMNSVNPDAALPKGKTTANKDEAEGKALITKPKSIGGFSY